LFHHAAENSSKIEKIPVSYQTAHPLISRAI
jgi:hypothetical protein